MSESARSTDADAPEAPAPWTLTGDGYIAMLDLPEAARRERSFIPDALRGRLEGRYSLLMALDYQSSNVGPYRELLFIPGRFRTRRGLCWSITKIYVSSWSSVKNGQRNWGIPKEHADIERTYEVDGSERFALSQDGVTFADLRFKPAGLPLPAAGSILPASVRTLVHEREGRAYYCAPNARGRVRYARMLEARVDEQRLPPLAEAKVVFAVRFSNFRADFPMADVESAEG